MTRRAVGLENLLTRFDVSRLRIALYRVSEALRRRRNTPLTGLLSAAIATPGPTLLHTITARVQRETGKISYRSWRALVRMPAEPN